MGKLTLNASFIFDYMKENKIKSKSEMASRVGISRSMLCKLLKEERNPGPKVVKKFLVYFDVPFETLFY